jgi:hypothetical protein
MINFENLHKNHKLAYIDGLLCGIVGTVIAVQMLQEYRDNRELRLLMKENKKLKPTK